MRPIKPLPPEYFSNYADEEIGVRDRSYTSNWRDYGFSRFEDYLRVLEKSYASTPNSVFETGSADGSVIRELTNRGIRARGVEFSKHILEDCDPQTRRKIARGNAIEVVNALPDESFDCVYETCAQYIPEEYLESYFRALHRIVKRDLVIVLHSVEEDPKPHSGQLNHWENKKWLSLIESCGFTNAYEVKKSAPFYFRKTSGGYSTATASGKDSNDVLIGLWTGWNIIFPDSTHGPLATTTGIKGTIPAKVLYDDNTMTYKAFTHTENVRDWREGRLNSRIYGGRPEEVEIKLANPKRDS